MNNLSIILTVIASTFIPALITLISVIFKNIRNLKIEKKFDAQKVAELIDEVKELKNDIIKKDFLIQELQTQNAELKLQNQQLRKQIQLLKEK